MLHSRVRSVMLITALLLAAGPTGFLVGTSDHLSRLVEAGVADSATFRSLWEALEATGSAQLTLVAASPDSRARVRSRVEVWSPATPRDAGCVAWLRAEIGVQKGGIRGRRVALLAHELAHLFRILQGSRDERAGTPGERFALDVEQRVAAEMDAAARGRRAVPAPSLVAVGPGEACEVTGAWVAGPAILLH